jgi:hypothetical protein
MPGLLKWGERKRVETVPIESVSFSFCDITILDIFSGYVFVFCYALKNMFAKFCFS